MIANRVAPHTSADVQGAEDDLASRLDLPNGYRKTSISANAEASEPRTQWLETYRAAIRFHRARGMSLERLGEIYGPDVVPKALEEPTDDECAREAEGIVLALAAKWTSWRRAGE